jgi:hypothetical protein
MWCVEHRSSLSFRIAVCLFVYNYVPVSETRGKRFDEESSTSTGKVGLKTNQAINLLFYYQNLIFYALSTEAIM